MKKIMVQNLESVLHILETLAREKENPKSLVLYRSLNNDFFQLVEESAHD